MNRSNGKATILGGDPSPVPDHVWPALGARLGITDREIAIVRGLFQRMNEASIASSLGISPHTVHTHLNRVYRKLNVQSRGDLFLRVVTELMHPRSVEESSSCGA